MIRIGILGAAGYTGGELIRVLLNHPDAEIVFANSESNAGNLVSDVHEGLLGETDLRFTSEMPFSEVDLVFFCFGHGKSAAFLSEHPELLSPRMESAGTGSPQGPKIIDLAQDFRIKPSPLRGEKEGGCLPFSAPSSPSLPPSPSLPSPSVPFSANQRSAAEGKANPSPSSHDFVYGLPEAHREAIRSARRLANPGCFATCIQLALLPALKAGILTGDIHVNGITGSTGAGQKPGATTHYSWRNDNISVYKTFTHQHLLEINQTIQELHPGYDGRVLFIPQRGCFARGIFVTAYAKCDAPLAEVQQLYADYYRDAAFTHFTTKSPDLKQVVNTNKAVVYVEKHDDQLLMVSCIDNLLKGAVGQAVQNMNLMFNLPEQTGLKLKASAF